MKLNTNYLRKAYHDAMIQQYISELRKDGFFTESEKKLSVGNLLWQADLYAEKNDEKRIYEFKLTGKNPKQKESIVKFKEFAKQIEAIPFVVYVNPPEDKCIEIEDLAPALFAYIEGEGIPSVLDELSTHTRIDDIEIDELFNIYVGPEFISVQGKAMIYVSLQYGSDSDDGIETAADFPMEFSVKVDHDLSVTDLEYDIDTSDWFD